MVSERQAHWGPDPPGLLGLWRLRLNQISLTRQFDPKVIGQSMTRANLDYLSEELGVPRLSSRKMLPNLLTEDCNDYYKRRFETRHNPYPKIDLDKKQQKRADAEVKDSFGESQQNPLKLLQWPKLQDNQRSWRNSTSLAASSEKVWLTLQLKIPTCHWSTGHRTEL